MKARKQYIYRFNYKSEIIEGTIEDLMAYTGKKYNAIHSYYSYPNGNGAMIVCGYKLPIFEALNKSANKVIAEGTIDDMADELGLSENGLRYRYELIFTGKFKCVKTSDKIPQLIKKSDWRHKPRNTDDTIDDVVAQIGRMKYLNRVNKDVYQPSPTMLKRLKEAGIKLEDIKEIKVEEGAGA